MARSAFVPPQDQIRARIRPWGDHAFHFSYEMDRGSKLVGGMCMFVLLCENCRSWYKRRMAAPTDPIVVDDHVVEGFQSMVDAMPSRIPNSCAEAVLLRLGFDVMES